MDNVLHKEGRVVSPANTNDEYIKRVIIAACQLNGISPAMVNPYIPNRHGLRNTFAFKCLLNISVTPRLTKTAYARLYSNCQQATCHAIDYLKELGLVCESGKPRLIIPLQRFKVDIAYNVTHKGSKAISDILTRVGIIETWGS